MTARSRKRVRVGFSLSPTAAEFARHGVTLPQIGEKHTCEINDFRTNRSNAIEQYPLLLGHHPNSIESCSSWVVIGGTPKPSGLGMVSIFRTSAARTLFAGMTKMMLADSGCNLGRLGTGLGFFRLRHWHGNQGGKLKKAVAFRIRTALASVHVDDTGHVGRCRVCPKASRTQRLLR